MLVIHRQVITPDRRAATLLAPSPPHRPAVCRLARHHPPAPKSRTRPSPQRLSSASTLSPLRLACARAVDSLRVARVVCIQPPPTRVCESADPASLACPTCAWEHRAALAAFVTPTQASHAVLTLRECGLPNAGDSASTQTAGFTPGSRRHGASQRLRSCLARGERTGRR